MCALIRMSAGESKYRRCKGALELTGESSRSQQYFYLKIECVDGNQRLSIASDLYALWAKRENGGKVVYSLMAF